MSTLSVTRIENVEVFDFANTAFVTAFNAANAAYSVSNTAYASVNSNWTVTNTVYGVANAAFASANNVAPQVAPAYLTANLAYATANAVFAASNAEYTFSNTVYAAVNSAFATINAVYGSSNSDYVVSNSAFAKANAALANTSGTVFAGDLRVTGNLQIGTNTVTIRDNHIISAEYYRMNTANHMVVVPDGNRVNTIFSLVNVSFDTANASYNSANNVGPQLAPAFNTANAAFGKANTALQNTTGTFAGILTVSGNVSLTGANNWILPMTSVIDNGVAGISWYQSSPSSYGIYRSSGAWTAPNYQQLYMQFDTGIVINGGSAFGKSGTIIQPGDGNVGIGTSSPGYKLDVAGTANAAALLVNGSPAVTKATTDWNYIGAVTATNAGAIQDTSILSTAGYTRFLLVIKDTYTITNATTLHMQFYSGGAYQGASYTAQATVLTSGGYTGMYLASSLYLSYPSQSSSVHPCFASIEILNPSNTTYWKPYFGQGTYYSPSNAQSQTYHYGGAWQGGTGAITGFRIFAAAGNVTGTVQVYGAVV